MQSIFAQMRLYALENKTYKRNLVFHLEEVESQENYEIL